MLLLFRIISLVFLWGWTCNMWSVKIHLINCLKFFSSADGLSPQETDRGVTFGHH